MTTSDAFLATLAQRPEDNATRLVYADWLEDNGQPEEALRLRLVALSAPGPLPQYGIARLLGVHLHAVEGEINAHYSTFPRYPQCSWTATGRQEETQTEFGARIADWVFAHRAAIEAAHVGILADAIERECQRREEARQSAYYRSRPYRRLSLAVRAAAGAAGESIPICTEDGFEAPHIVGSRYVKYHFRRSYPSGKTFAKTVYHPSTRKVVVGRGWLIAQGLA